MLLSPTLFARIILEQTIADEKPSDSTGGGKLRPLLEGLGSDICIEGKYERGVP